jgi:hypothetical protein
MYGFVLKPDTHPMLLDAFRWPTALAQSLPISGEEIIHRTHSQATACELRLLRI